MVASPGEEHPRLSDRCQHRVGLCREGVGVGHWGGGLGQGWRGPDDPAQKLALIQRALGSLPAGFEQKGDKI